MTAIPKPQWPLFRSLRHSKGRNWRYDLVAGLTLAAIAIPEQMATARLGGFPPQLGFWAFVAGSIAFAAFGASRFLSAGADSTIVPIFAGALALTAAVGSPHYASLAAVLAVLVGAILIAGGIFRAGWVADLLSLPVTTGFLAGVSVHIVVSQLPALLGLNGVEGDVVDRLGAIAAGVGQTNFSTLAIGLFCLATIVVGEKISSRIPGALIALVLATFAVRALDLEQRGVAVLGAVSAELPRPIIPAIALADLSQLTALAVIVAAVVMVQTAATSRSFTAGPDDAPDVHRDFLGVGVGSVVAGLVGAFPVNASPPRTAIVVETGGKTQIAGLVAAFIVATLAFFGAALLEQVPNAALAGVLMFIAGRIFRAPVILDIHRKTRAEFALVVVTILAVVFLPVQTGVGLAIVLSLAHGMWTTTRTRLIVFERVPGTTVWWPESSRVRGETLAGVLVVAFQAPLSFLNAYQFQHDVLSAIGRADQKLKLVVLEAGSIVEIDFSAAQVLAEIIARCRALGIDFAIARLESLRAQTALENFCVMKELGEGRLFQSVDQATRALAAGAEVRSEPSATNDSPE